jgi:four helix bundle protein
MTIRKLVCEVYKVSSYFPSTEKYNLAQQVQRAALSVKLTFAEGASRRSIAERNRYFEIARGSVVELGAAFETAIDLGYVQIDNLMTLSMLLNKCFAMITNISNSVNKQS